MRSPTTKDRLRGCLLGGAVGDALGAPIEFWSGARIGDEFGTAGIQQYLPAEFGDTTGVGLITDDTQMTLFTVEGLIRAWNRATSKGICSPPAVIHHAYQRWLTTQEFSSPPETSDLGDPHMVDGWLGQERWLYSRRAPGNTCLAALQATRGRGFGHAADNRSKGCGAVMRSAPFGLVPWDEALEIARLSAALTHGHPTGVIAAVALAEIVRCLMRGQSLEVAVGAAIDYAGSRPAGLETQQALQAAVDAVAQGAPSFARVQSLGEGWVAEEALAIAVYCALVYPRADQFRQALALAVSHGGDSDSTGAICGNILGALHGVSAIPADLLEHVEGRTTIETLASHLLIVTEQPDLVIDWLDTGEGPDGSSWWELYPGW